RRDQEPSDARTREARSGTRPRGEGLAGAEGGREEGCRPCRMRERSSAAPCPQPFQYRRPGLEEQPVFDEQEPENVLVLYSLTTPTPTLLERFLVSSDGRGSEGAASSSSCPARSESRQRSARP